MKIFALILLSFCCPNTPAQEDVKAKHEAYYRCINSIPKFNAPFTDTTKEAFQNCSDYLQKYPNDDPRLVEFATKWVIAYKRISLYLDSIKRYWTSENSEIWIINQEETKKDIPIINETEGTHKVEISRDFANNKEDNFLKIAEAVYLKPNETSEQLFKFWHYWSQPQIELPKDEIRWSNGTFDTIKQTRIVTTGAVLYYLDISNKLKTNDNKIEEKSFIFHNTQLKYWSSIKKVSNYERSGKTFENVYVADVNLTWSQVCGGLCGAGFTRNKVVVLDENGNVLELFLDAKVNFTRWVS